MNRPTYKRSLAALLTLAAGVGGLSLSARPAQADSEDTWRAVTYGAAAATVYSAVNKKSVPAVIGAAGTYVAYEKWQDAKEDRRRDERYGRYDDRRYDDRRYDSRRYDDRRYNDRRYDDRRYDDRRCDDGRYEDRRYDDRRYDSRNRDRDYRYDDRRYDDRRGNRRRDGGILGDIFKGDRRSDRAGDIFGDILRRNR